MSVSCAKMGTQNWSEMNKESKENSWGSGIAFLSNQKNTAFPDSPQLYSPHGTYHLALVMVGTCLTAPIEMQDLGGWHLCQSHFPILHSTRGHRTLHGLFIKYSLSTQKKKYSIYTE